MKDKIQEFKISVSVSEFGTLEKFYQTYAKGNREILIEYIEYEGKDEQHNVGLMNEKFFCKRSELKEKVQKFIDDNSLQQECFSVTNEKDKEVMQEGDL